MRDEQSTENPGLEKSEASVRKKPVKASVKTRPACEEGRPFKPSALSPLRGSIN